MKEIKITNSDLVALVDDDMYEELSKLKWHLHNHGYVQNHSIRYMHRYINKTPKGVHTDHINGNKLDNRRENLRNCTKSQNQMNINRTIGTRTGYRGVTYDKRKLKSPFQARIRVDGKQITIGVYSTPEEAALAYNEKALEHHGEFAILNKLKKLEESNNG